MRRIRKLAGLTAIAYAFLFGIFFAGAAAAQAQGSVNASPTTEDCSIDRFTDALADAAHWQAMMSIKHEVMRLPNPGSSLGILFQTSEATLKNQLSQAARGKVFDALAELSHTHRTLALIYQVHPGLSQGDHTCVWLADEKGVLASGTVAIGEDWQPDSIWINFDVDARSARNRPFPRKRDSDCEQSSSAQYEATPDNLSREYAALKDTSERILPQTVRAALLAESPDERLLILPVASIGKVPFAALPVGTDRLIDKFSILLLPGPEAFGISLAIHPTNQPFVFRTSVSIDLLDVSRHTLPKKHNSPSGLVIADPDLSFDKQRCWQRLPSARDEGAYAVRLMNATPLPDKAATFQAVESRLKAGQGSLDFIYFATHGYTDPINPADGSFLALGNRMLNGATIQKLNFTNRPLVVMSACETGLGKEFAGGLYGLADAWIFARAGEVVSSLWDVSDTGTDTLMHSFIDSLTNRIRSEPDRRLSGGAEYALAAAIRTTKGQLVDPAVWSAFTVYGYPSAE